MKAAVALRTLIVSGFPPALSLAAALLAGAGSASAAAQVDGDVHRALTESPTGNLYVVVMLRPVAGDMLAVEREVPRRQARVLGAIPASDFTPVYRYRTFAAMTGVVTAAGLGRLAANPEVERVLLDEAGQGGLDSSVPYIGANTTFSAGVTGDNVTVAVLDSGIDTDHVNLMDNVAPGAWHFLGGGADVGPGAEDDNGHGSNVSGIITSFGAGGNRGVAPDADILAIKVLDSFNSGFLSDWAAGVDHVVANRLSYPNLIAINMSLVSFAAYTACPCDASQPALQAAINAAKSVGIATFVSSGNVGLTTAMPSPACNSASIPVAAVYDQSLGREPDAGTYSGAFGSGFGNCFDANAVPGLVTCFSCRNACNEIAAPGRSITAPYWTGGNATYTGTSQAAPHAAAVAALVRETRLDYGLPAHTPDELLALLKGTGITATDLLAVQPIPKIVNALFAVDGAVPPLVTTVHPNGAEQLLLGSPDTLRWNASDNIGVNRVDLAYSTTGPAGAFTTIATNLANTGSHAWTVTGPVSADCWLRVIGRDAASNATTDFSDAAFSIVDPVAVGEDGPTAALAFARVAPNPSTGPTLIEYVVPRAAEVSLRVLDVQGRVVARLASGAHPAGRHAARWSGIGAHGPAMAGLYFLELRSRGEVRSRRLVLAM